MSAKISFRKSVDVHFGENPSEIALEIQCRCGEKHLVPLDFSGHYSGKMPCDTADTEVQVDPGMWRQIMEHRISIIRH